MSKIIECLKNPPMKRVGSPITWPVQDYEKWESQILSAVKEYVLEALPKKLEERKYEPNDLAGRSFDFGYNDAIDDCISAIKQIGGEK